MKLKKGDQIIVTAGKDAGRKGKIETVDAKGMVVTVPGVNVYKRHEKKRDEKRPGGIVEYARPLPVGNVALLCPKCGKPTRVGFLVTKKEKERICKKCKQKI